MNNWGNTATVNFGYISKLEQGELHLVPTELTDVLIFTEFLKLESSILQHPHSVHQYVQRC